MTRAIQTAMCFLASYGFGLMFNIHGRRLVWIGLGGALSWMVYLYALNITGSVFISMMMATAAIVAASEILARRIKVPVVMLAAPMLIPMVPGGDLYYTMSYLVSDQNELFLESLRSLLLQAGAIAAGIILMTSVMTNFFAIYYRIKRR